MSKPAAANRISLRLALRVLSQIFEFGGRSTRSAVVSFWLLMMLANLPSLAWHDPGLAGTIAVVRTTWMLLWTWPWLPLLVRRLHDQGRTGWWALLDVLQLLCGLGLVLLASPTPVAGFSVSYLGSEPLFVAWSPATVTLATIGSAASIIVVIFLLLPGVAGPNRYGPDPRLGVDRAASHGGPSS